VLRVFTKPQQIIQNTNFGFETSERALQQFESAFEIQYELEKLDQVALPFFNRCGTENYGIAFYRENCFLYEPFVSKHTHSIFLLSI
jgi:aminopeptidase N